MKKYLQILIVIGLLFVNKLGFSQDIHFSQYYAAPLSLNPANTGFYTGDWRAYGIYRTQWKTISIPFVTQSLGFDHQLQIYNENFSWGIHLINDKSGSIGLMANQFYLSLAYHKPIAKVNNFHFGLQAGYVLKSFSLTGHTYPEQWDMGIGQFNSALNPGEPGSFDQPSFLDVNGGIIWNRKFGKAEPQIGYAMYHINQPKSVYTTSNNKIEGRHVIHTEVKINVYDKIFVSPRIMYMTMGKAKDFVTGIQCSYAIPQNTFNLNSCWVGAYIRNLSEKNKDAAYFVAGINYNNFDIGFSYDINISELKAATNNRGAFEFSIVYTAPSSKITKKAIPCERY